MIGRAWGPFSRRRLAYLRSWQYFPPVTLLLNRHRLFPLFTGFSTSPQISSFNVLECVPRSSRLWNTIRPPPSQTREHMGTTARDRSSLIRTLIYTWDLHIYQPRPSADHDSLASARLNASRLARGYRLTHFKMLYARLQTALPVFATDLGIRPRSY
jgi:hypothetical protein